MFDAIFSVSRFKQGHARLTTVPFKPARWQKIRLRIRLKKRRELPECCWDKSEKKTQIIPYTVTWRVILGQFPQVSIKYPGREIIPEATQPSPSYTWIRRDITVPRDIIYKPNLLTAIHGSEDISQYLEISFINLTFSLLYMDQKGTVPRETILEA